MTAGTTGRLADAPDQADLSLEAELDWAPHVLATIPWHRPVSPQGELVGEYPGVEEFARQRHLATTALLNDLARAGIMADARLDPVAFAEWARDEHRPTRGVRAVRDAQGVQIGFSVQGPSPTEWRPDNRLHASYRPGTFWWRFTTDAWHEVPAFVAHWYWWQELEDPRLGAAYRRSLKPEERDPDQGRDATRAVASVYARLAERWEDGAADEPPPRRLFQFRMQCERPPGERPSGIIDPRVTENEASLAAARAEIAQLQERIARLQKKGEGNASHP